MTSEIAHFWRLNTLNALPQNFSHIDLYACLMCPVLYFSVICIVFSSEICQWICSYFFMQGMKMRMTNLSMMPLLTGSSKIWYVACVHLAVVEIEVLISANWKFASNHFQLEQSGRVQREVAKSVSWCSSSLPLSPLPMWMSLFMNLFPAHISPQKHLISCTLVFLSLIPTYSILQYKEPSSEDIRFSRGHQLPLTCIVISPDCKHLYTASKDCSIIKC